MQAVPLAFNGIPTRYLVIGGAGIELRREYDPDQLWLPFMFGAIYQTQLAPKPHFGQLKRRRVQREYASVSDADRQLYRHEPGQLVVPFPGRFQAVSNREADVLATCGWPGWERDEDKALIRFEHKHRGSGTDQIRKWCIEHCRGRFFVTSSMCTFQYATDAVFAKLRWG